MEHVNVWTPRRHCNQPDCITRSAVNATHKYLYTCTHDRSLRPLGDCHVHMAVHITQRDTTNTYPDTTMKIHNARPVVGNDRYIVTDEAKIYDLNKQRWLAITPSTQPTKTNKYSVNMVHLKSEGRRKHCQVRRLVAQAFMKNYNPKRSVLVRHRYQDIFKNDHISNLRQVR